MITLQAAGATDVGQVRQVNEDQLLMAEPLFAVADGMGGHAAGEVASLTAIEALMLAFDGNRSSQGLVDAVHDANRAVWEQARDRSELRGMGTTLTAVALIDEDGEEVLAVVNVGDSRAYLFRDGVLDQLTEDHSVPAELHRAGRLSAEEAANDPRRHVLTRVLGVDPEVEVDYFSLIPYRGDRLLLASDGLFGEVSDADIASVLRRRADPERVAEQLVALANDSGGTDNVTVVVIDVVDDDDRAARVSAAVTSGPVTAMPRSLPSAKGPAGEAPTEPMPRLPDEDGAAAVPDVATPPVPPGPVEEPTTPRRSTASTVAFVFVLLLLLASAAAAVVVYARGSYFVGVREDRVAIFKGRPGGLLWFEPTLEEDTGVRVSDVLPATADVLRRGKEEPSVDKARRYVRNIEAEASRARTVDPTQPPSAPPPAMGPPPGPAP